MNPLVYQFMIKVDLKIEELSLSELVALNIFGAHWKKFTSQQLEEN